MLDKTISLILICAFLWMADVWAAGPGALSPRSGLGVSGGAPTEEEKMVRRLIKVLSYWDRDARNEAAWALVRFGPAAVPALVDALRHRNWRVRLQAAWVLGMIRPSEAGAVLALIDALRDRREVVRFQAAWALGRIGPSTRGFLISHLAQESDERIRETILDILELLDYFEEHTPTSFIPAWSFNDALGKLCKGAKDEQTQATQRMIHLLQAEPRHRQEVMNFIKDVNKVMELVEGDVNKVEGVRWRLVVALGTVDGDEVVVEFLEGIASDRQEAKLVRRNAVRSLGFLGQQRSIKVLTRIKNDPGLESVVASAIHQIELAQAHEIGRAPTEGGVFFDRFSVVGLEALEALEEAADVAVESAI